MPSALPSAAASTGPRLISSDVRRRSASSSNGERIPPPNTRSDRVGTASVVGSDASTCAVDAAIDSTAQRVTAARSVASARSASSAMVPAMSAGARRRSSSASTMGTPSSAAAAERRPSRSGSPHWRRHSSTSHHPATLRRSRTPPSAPSSLLQPGREGRTRGVGRRAFLPDEQPCPRRHERRIGARRRPAPPTRCRVHPRGAPGHRATSPPAFLLLAAAAGATIGTPTRSASSDDHVRACTSSSPVVLADEYSPVTTPVRWWTSSSGSISIAIARAPSCARS